jgi:hypothetical protein
MRQRSPFSVRPNNKTSKCVWHGPPNIAGPGIKCEPELVLSRHPATGEIVCHPIGEEPWKRN